MFAPKKVDSLDVPFSSLPTFAVFALMDISATKPTNASPVTLHAPHAETPLYAAHAQQDTTLTPLPALNALNARMDVPPAASLILVTPALLDITLVEAIVSSAPPTRPPPIAIAQPELSGTRLTSPAVPALLDAMYAKMELLARPALTTITSLAPHARLYMVQSVTPSYLWELARLATLAIITSLLTTLATAALPSLTASCAQALANALSAPLDTTLPLTETVLLAAPT